VIPILSSRRGVLHNKWGDIVHFDVDLPRPRDLDSPGYLEKRDRIFRVMGMSLRVGETAAA
jgi:hypothetical protein